MLVKPHVNEPSTARAAVTGATIAGLTVDTAAAAAVIM